MWVWPFCFDGDTLRDTCLWSGLSLLNVSVKEKDVLCRKDIFPRIVLPLLILCLVFPHSYKLPPNSPEQIRNHPQKCKATGKTKLRFNVVWGLFCVFVGDSSKYQKCNALFRLWPLSKPGKSYRNSTMSLDEASFCPRQAEALPTCFWRFTCTKKKKTCLNPLHSW